jgi:hypothetical protein
MAGIVKTKTAPTPYPRIIFHIIRFSQAIAALVVSSIMFYFIWNLVHEEFEAPKTFWTVSCPYRSVTACLPKLTDSQLLAASLLTFLTLIGTMIVYAFFGLSPLWNLCINALLLILWAPAFAFLWFWTKKTQSHVCSQKTWEDETGIMICRIYKALFAFSMFGV